jgi:solute:Na+ symporter, SSS family
MIVTFGMVATFCAIVVFILQRSFVADKSFTDYAVGGRSFGGLYQAMSFLNTWYPGATFVALAGLSASAGVLGLYILAYSLLTVVLMYLIARRVWLWGAKFDLRTQPDLFALRYGSTSARTVAAVIGLISVFPWLILGFQSIGVVFRALSFGTLSLTAAVTVGVILMIIRQIWTIRMGMRGIVISDMFQGIVAYIVGGFLVAALIGWLVHTHNAGFDKLPETMFALPGPGSATGPLYYFSIVFTGAIGGWCWASVFVRLYTANGVRSLKRSAAIGVPLSFLFYMTLTVFALYASVLPEVQKAPEQVFFIVSEMAGGVWALGLAGTVVLAASMGSVDGIIQAAGAQIASDIVGGYRTVSHKQMLLVAKVSMLGVTLLAAFLACFEIPHLFLLAILAYQGVIQLAVPQFLGIFWKRGNKYGAIAGMVVGFAVAALLEWTYPNFLPWAYGLTSGVVALAVNLLIYVGAAYLFPASSAERNRVDKLFADLEDKASIGPATSPVAPLTA